MRSPYDSAGLDTSKYAIKICYGSLNKSGNCQGSADKSPTSLGRSRPTSPKGLCEDPKQRKARRKTTMQTQRLVQRPPKKIRRCSPPYRSCRFGTATPVYRIRSSWRLRSAIWNMKFSRVKNAMFVKQGNAVLNSSSVKAIDAGSTQVRPRFGRYIYIY